MINRWQGNSGKVQRFPEHSDNIRHHPPPAAPPRPQAPLQRSPAQSKAGGIFSALDGLKKLIPGKAEELETEDIILLLILYLMYRESGDSELLMIMGAMFLL